MRADLQSLVDRFGATGWYYSPVDPNTPRFYTTHRDWTAGGAGFGRHIPPEDIAASGASLGDFVPHTWDNYPDGPIALTDNTRGFVWHPNMSRYVTRAFEIRDEGYYDIAPNSRSFFDRLTFGVAVGLIAGGTAAIGAGLAGVDVSMLLATESPLVGPVETPLLVGPVETVLAPAAVADVAPFVGPIEVATTATPGWSLTETIAAAKTVGTTTMEGVKVLNQVAGAVGAVAAVSAAIQGPVGGSAPAPAPAPAPDSVGEKFGAVFDDLKTKLSKVDKKTWYMIGGAVVLLSLG